MNKIFSDCSPSSCIIYNHTIIQSYNHTIGKYIMFSNSNFINFINHLLTFNQQQELLKKKNENSNLENEDLPFRFNISSKVLIKLCNLAKSIFEKESNILTLSAPIYVFGDIHGQYSDLIHFLEMTGLPPDNSFLFLGDYVDRGNNSIEVCALLFAMKIIFPNNIYLLRGNHECPEVNRLYGLYTECETRFGDEEKEIVFNALNSVLCSLPLCAVINKKIFCVHGGISPQIKSLDNIKSINRFTTIPNDGILCDLMWSDPTSIDSIEWGANSRGVSCTYGTSAISKFLKMNNLQLICRAHQLVSDGYKFFSDNKLLTVFSAPNYCGNCGNDGAVMKLTNELEGSFIIIKPTNTDLTNQINKKQQKQKQRMLDRIDY